MRSQQPGRCPRCGGPAIVNGYRKGISWRPEMWRFEFLCEAMLSLGAYPKTYPEGWHRHVIVDFDAGEM